MQQRETLILVTEVSFLLIVENRIHTLEKTRFTLKKDTFFSVIAYNKCFTS